MTKIRNNVCLQVNFVHTLRTGSGDLFHFLGKSGEISRLVFLMWCVADLGTRPCYLQNKSNIEKQVLRHVLFVFPVWFSDLPAAIVLWRRVGFFFCTGIQKNTRKTSDLWCMGTEWHALGFLYAIRKLRYTARKQSKSFNQQEVIKPNMKLVHWLIFFLSFYPNLVIFQSPPTSWIFFIIWHQPWKWHASMCFLQDTWNHYIILILILYYIRGQLNTLRSTCYVTDRFTDTHIWL